MRRLAIFLALAVILSLLGVSAVAAGNGAPNGAHYNLNIIGVPNDKTADMDGETGGRIFVPLYGNAKILLAEGSDFRVLDANGTDRDGAKFQLPLPGECYGTWVDDDFVTPDTCTVRYTVWLRGLGKPNGSMTMYTCLEDPDVAGDYICSDPDWWVEVTRSKGKSTFTNVSKELLFVSADVDGDGTVEHVQIFDPAFETYYWQYNNTGLKLAQLRFYMGAYDIDWR